MISLLACLNVYWKITKARGHLYVYCIDFQEKSMYIVKIHIAPKLNNIQNEWTKSG
jgi:hypothetical protein